MCYRDVCAVRWEPWRPCWSEPANDAELERKNGSKGRSWEIQKMIDAHSEGDEGWTEVRKLMYRFLS